MLLSLATFGWAVLGERFGRPLKLEYGKAKDLRRFLVDAACAKGLLLNEEAKSK